MSDTSEKVTVPEAAQILNISEGAVRMRLNRGTLQSERDDNGRVVVLLRRDNTEHHEGETTPLVESLQDQISYLREQLDREREANRENRRLLAAALERIPAIEAPQDTSSDERESPVSASEPRSDSPGTQEEKPSWWQRWFGAG
jgi:hypothetical protein